MFSQKDVNALCSAGADVFRRSQTLIDERQRKTIKKKIDSNTNHPLQNDPFIANVIKPLHQLSEIQLLMDVCVLWQSELEKEIQNDHSSSNKFIQKQRGNGVCFPLLKKGVKLLLDAGGSSIHDWNTSHNNNNNNNNVGASLWNQEEEEDTAHKASGEGSGASLCARLCLLAFYTDLHYLYQHHERKVDGTVMNTELQQLIEMMSVQLLPSSVMQTFISLLASTSTALPLTLLASDKEESHHNNNNNNIPSFLNLFPSFTSFIILHGEEHSRLYETFVKAPLQAFSSSFLPYYLQSSAASQTAAHCQETITYLKMIVTQLISSTTAKNTARVEEGLKRVMELFLAPLETQFTSDKVRRGMSWFFYTNMVLPFQDMISQNNNNNNNTSVILYTFVYRLLMLVETLSSTELANYGNHSDKTNNTVQQKRYERLIHQSGSKMSVPLLREVTEDRELIFEAVEGGRSPTGHVLYKICDDEDSKSGIYLYLESGKVFYRSFSEKEYKRAKGIDELYTIFREDEEEEVS
ncbi:hypothetical protein ADEAN_000799200 [Angomonas deanei]|uniref:Uncharacterized protein n=1 Tax=Angomonas deanei TaxID=59799 RepID=A0A7G2CKS6_9TRYP|nr:hypothetical protein ADEAN_000799200 [Angomonas deanei]